MFRTIKMYIRSPGGNDSQPSTVRVFSYKNFFEKNYIAECCLDVSGNKSTFYIWILCILGRYDAVFLSMPPFRGWGLFFLPFTRVILDVRDGWSIAMGSGYGGNLQPKPFKAKIARLVEKFAIRRSFVSITCTKGLQEYLQNVSGRQVLLVPNGVACDDLDLILNLKHKVTKVNFSDQLIFCCAGQFSEYGKIKVEKLLRVIAKRYPDRRLKIKLIGSDLEKNNWVVEYFKSLTAGVGVVEITPRMSKIDMYAEMMGCDFGLSIIRDPDYDYGTKIYEYIALGLPVVNYFDGPNNFTEYFDACLDEPFNKNSVLPEVRRNVLIESALAHIKW